MFAFLKELRRQVKTVVHEPAVDNRLAVIRAPVYIFLFCHVRAPSLRAMTLLLLLLLLLIDFRQALQCELQCRPLQEGSDEDVDSKARGYAGFSGHKWRDNTLQTNTYIFITDSRILTLASVSFSYKTMNCSGLNDPFCRDQVTSASLWKHFLSSCCGGKL